MPSCVLHWRKTCVLSRAGQKKAGGVSSDARVPLSDSVQRIASENAVTNHTNSKEIANENADIEHTGSKAAALNTETWIKIIRKLAPVYDV